MAKLSRCADLKKSARQFSHGLDISMCYTLSSKTLEDTKAQAVFYVDVKNIYQLFTHHLDRQK